MKIFRRSEARFEWSNSRALVLILIALVLVSAALVARSAMFGKQRLETGKANAPARRNNSASPRNQSTGSKDADEKATSPSSVQVFGPIDPSVIAGGGGTSSSTSFVLHGTLGEPAVGQAMSNGQFSLEGGFWQSIAAVTPKISGRLTYANGSTPGKNVTITLTGPAGFTTQTTTTDTNGDYSFAGVPLGSDYTVTPSKTGDVNGLESFDAAFAARYVAGLDIPTANQRIAADADGDGLLTSLDAALIARRAAGLPGFGIVGTWKFSPANRTYAPLSVEQTGQNFTAILVGDTSGDWTPALPSGGGDDANRSGGSLERIRRSTPQRLH